VLLRQIIVKFENLINQNKYYKETATGHICKPLAVIIMKAMTKITLVTILTLLGFENVKGQNPPFAAMFRFGNTDYYHIDTISANQLFKTNRIFDKEITNSYIDTDLKNKTIILTINNENLTFKQKERNGTKHNSHKLFYKRRKLYCYKDSTLYARIDYMKLITLTSDTLNVECSVNKVQPDNSIEKFKVMTPIPINELDGLFVGPGKNQRIFVPVIGVSLLLLFFGISGS
jgi:hypothetical protein